MIYGRSSTPVTGTITGLAGRLRSTVLGGFENGRDTARVTSNIESIARIRIKRFMNIFISFMVQQVIIFSETLVGFDYAHTVANRPSGFVAQNLTKIGTYSESEANR